MTNEPRRSDIDFASNGQAASEPDSLNTYLRSCEREFILRALEQHRWRVSETAEGLKISRKNLWEKMRKLNIDSRHD